MEMGHTAEKQNLAIPDTRNSDTISDSVSSLLCAKSFADPGATIAKKNLAYSLGSSCFIGELRENVVWI